MTAVLFIGLLIISYQSNCWQAGNDMGWGVMDFCWTCLETCPELPQSRYLISYIAIWWINSKVPEGSMITNENNSVTCESSRVITLKSHLNSTGHSASTSEVRDIFDRQTYVPNDWWELMCSHVLQPWDCCNSMTAPVPNITLREWRKCCTSVCYYNPMMYRYLKTFSSNTSLYIFHKFN